MAAKTDTTEAQKKIVKALGKKTLNKPQLAEATKLSPGLIGKALADLKAGGKVEFEGAKRTGGYKLLS